MRRVPPEPSRREPGPDPLSVQFVFDKLSPRALILKLPAVSWTTASRGQPLSASWMLAVSSRSPPLGEMVLYIVVRLGMPPLYVTPGCQVVTRLAEMSPPAVGSGSDT